MAQVQLNVGDEVVAAGDALQMLIADLIAKKPVAQIVSDVLPRLVVAMGAYGDFAKDIVLADDEAYLVRSLKLGINGK